MTIKGVLRSFEAGVTGGLPRGLSGGIQDVCACPFWSVCVHRLLSYLNCSTGGADFLLFCNWPVSHNRRPYNCSELCVSLVFLQALNCRFAEPVQLPGPQLLALRDLIFGHYFLEYSSILLKVPSGLFPVFLHLVSQITSFRVLSVLRESLTAASCPK